jgi:hypothetical protein
MSLALVARGVVAAALAWMMLLGSSQLLVAAGLQSYGSEADQQRNFGFVCWRGSGLRPPRGVWLEWRIC